MFVSCRGSKSKAVMENRTAEAVRTASAAASAAKTEDDRGYESLQHKPSTDSHQYERVNPGSTAADKNRTYTSLQHAPSTVSCQYEIVSSIASLANIKHPIPAFYEELAL